MALASHQRSHSTGFEYGIFNDLLLLLDAVSELCDEDAREELMRVCHKLPEKECYRGERKPKPKCDDHEFLCGSGECIDRLSVCDYVSDCWDGCDERQW